MKHYAITILIALLLPIMATAQKSVSMGNSGYVCNEPSTLLFEIISDPQQAELLEDIIDYGVEPNIYLYFSVPNGIKMVLKWNINEDNIDFIRRNRISESWTIFEESYNVNYDGFLSSWIIKIGDYRKPEIHFSNSRRHISMYTGGRFIGFDKMNSQHGNSNISESPNTTIQPEVSSSNEYNNTASAYLTGKIGNYPVEMEVKVNENGYIGRHRYTSSGAGTWLALKGENDSDYITHIREFDNGKLCGEYVGSFDTYETGAIVFHGTFTNAKGRQFKFKLEGRWR